jgi:hypothetical protein
MLRPWQRLVSADLSQKSLVQKAARKCKKRGENFFNPGYWRWSIKGVFCAAFFRKSGGLLEGFFDADYFDYSKLSGRRADL